MPPVVPPWNLYGTLGWEGAEVTNSAPTDGDQPDRPTALAVLDPPPPSGALVFPALMADLGEAAALRFIDFFTAHIRNPNTRAAYAVAVRGFFGIGLGDDEHPKDLAVHTTIGKRGAMPDIILAVREW